MVHERHEAGLPQRDSPEPAELELAWHLHSGIFYYGIRKHIYGLTVLAVAGLFVIPVPASLTESCFSDVVASAMMTGL